ncbi:MAG: nucleotide sugar dehydrogenase [Pseudomonadota bacterium]
MSKSLSPITGTEYLLPADPDDKTRLTAFVEQHAGKQVVVVQGLGFVGAVTSLVVANALSAEYAVIGVDLPTPQGYWKIAGINGGEFPITSSDPNVQTLYESCRQKGNLLATHDPYAYALADIVLVDMNLDVQKAGGTFDVDLSAFTAGIESIATRCKEDVLVLVESTVPPGACEQVVVPTLEAAFESRGLPRKFKVGHSYERVTPGPNYINSMRNFYRVYSGVDKASADAVQAFLETIISVDEYPLTRLANTKATEMAKVLENSYRAMNIAFVQEWTEFAENAGVNLFEVIDAIRMRPTHANLMKPGLGVGGYCLTKDPLLASWAAQSFFSAPSLPQSEAAVGINDRMPEHTFRRISAAFPDGLANRRCLLLGVSYLNDVGDTRYTPVEHLYSRLKAAGVQIQLHDPYVSFWDEQQVTVESDLDLVLETEYDMLVICTAHSVYTKGERLKAYLERARDMMVVDTWGVLNTAELTSIGRNNRVIAIGRGDLG